MTHGLDTGFLVAAEVAEHSDHEAPGSSCMHFGRLETVLHSRRRCWPSLCTSFPIRSALPPR